MRYKGTLKSILRGFDDTVSILIDLDTKNLSNSLTELQNSNIILTLDKYHKPRSNDANRYYWELLGQLAEKLNVSTPYLHNRYLKRCGYVDSSIYERIDGQAVSVYLPDTINVEREIEEDTENHFLPTKSYIQGKKGERLRGYILLKGSHEFNSKQFSRLIGFLAEDCKDQGIETMTPQEINKLCQLIKRI